MNRQDSGDRIQGTGKRSVLEFFKHIYPHPITVGYPTEPRLLTPDSCHSVLPSQCLGGEQLTPAQERLASPAGEASWIPQCRWCGKNMNDDVIQHGEDCPLAEVYR